MDAEDAGAPALDRPLRLGDRFDMLIGGFVDPDARSEGVFPPGAWLVTVLTSVRTPIEFCPPDLFLTRRAAPQARLKADAVKERGKGYSSSQLTQAGGKAYLFTDIENYGSLFVDNKCPTDVMARYLEVNHTKKGVQAWACNYGEVCHKFVEEYDEGTLLKHCEPMTKTVYSYYFPGLDVRSRCVWQSARKSGL